MEECKFTHCVQPTKANSNYCKGHNEFEVYDRWESNLSRSNTKMFLGLERAVSKIDSDFFAGG